MTDSVKMETIRDVLARLEYKPKTPYFQFQTEIALSGGGQGTVKVDLLAPNPRTDRERSLVKINEPRIRPCLVSKIHAYLTKEAITIEKNLSTVEIEDGDETVEIFLPHPYTFLVLKLFALRDHLNEEKKKPEERTKKNPKPAEHAYDIYRIIAMLPSKNGKKRPSSQKVITKTR